MTQGPIDEEGRFIPRHAADDYADIAKRMRSRWIPKREECTDVA